MRPSRRQAAVPPEAGMRQAVRSRSWVATARSRAARPQDRKLATQIASDRDECAQRQNKA